MNAVGTSMIVVDVLNKKAWWESIGGEPEEWIHVYEDMFLARENVVPGVDAYLLRSENFYLVFASSQLKEYIGQDDSWGDRCDITSHQQKLIEGYLRENGFDFITRSEETCL